MREVKSPSAVVLHHDVQNDLLNRLPEGLRYRIAPYLEHIDLVPGQILAVSGHAQTHVYFPNSALVSVLGSINQRLIDIQVFGRNGMSPSGPPSDPAAAPHTCQVRIGATAWRVPIHDWLDLVAGVPALEGVISSYCEATRSDLAIVSAMNGLCTIEQRLAWCLLTCAEHLGLEQIELTHSTLAIMLAVQRPGITTSLHLLESVHAISSTRGRILVRHAAILRSICDGLSNAATVSGTPENASIGELGTGEAPLSWALNSSAAGDAPSRRYLDGSKAPPSLPVRDDMPPSSLDN